MTDVNEWLEQQGGQFVGKDGFVNWVKAECEKRFNPPKFKWESESPQDLHMWMASMFMSEDMADLSTKDIATMIQTGSMPSCDTTEKADRYFLQQFEGCIDGTGLVDLEALDQLMSRIDNFLQGE